MQDSNIGSFTPENTEIKMISLILKTVLVIAIAYTTTLFSAQTHAKEVNSIYGITTTTFDDKPTADEYIQLKGTTISRLDDPSAEKVRIEVIKHKELNLFLTLDGARPFTVTGATQTRLLGRKGEDGFTVLWGKVVDAKQLLGLFGSNVQFYQGAYYAYVDTTGDKKVNRVYKVFLSPKKGQTPYIIGFAEKENGSEITSLEAAKKGKL